MNYTLQVAHDFAEALTSRTGWAGGLALAVVLLAGTMQGCSVPDNSDDWDRVAELQELQSSEAGTARREAAAQALCNQERGPNSEARWTPEGHLVCTTRRGVVAVQL